MTNELLNNLDTDDLVDFINNCSSKKEDLKKTTTTTFATVQRPEEQAQATASQIAALCEKTGMI